MRSGRLEAFSDGVLAIIITIMVLELSVPDDTNWGSLLEIAPTLISYILSFIYVGIYWNNHHHLFQVTRRVNGKVLWANLHLLFWLSLIPFTTSWVGENHQASLPVASYGFVLMMAAVGWYILQRTLRELDPENEDLAQVTKGGPKEIVSVVLYALSIGLAFANVWVSIGIIFGIAALWVIPEKGVETIDYQG
ncbi:DUF1211 domain-containing protein [Membranicola marinus]|uniref:DUF1211 domain-containing protein n=1 Tax=Membranihabitans marinus TaxID=1227546 RepID=A0A953L9I3_9BACT|nr:TMEM175 family protein [Membranihabitans marinus]MBY5956681.1 DUF1211 domain-containing protein [Membranihabitans marinus]